VGVLVVHPAVSPPGAGCLEGHEGAMASYAAPRLDVLELDVWDALEQGRSLMTVETA